MGDPEWFRASSWDAGTAERFEARLRRARASNRAQYIRIQASHLVESPDAATREIGRALLSRVIDDFLARARVAHAQRAPGAAAELARAALQVADDTSTPLPRHPTVGRPTPTGAERAELHSIASAG